MKNDIIDKIKALIDEKFVTEEVTYVPNIENSKLTFGNKGLLFDSTVLYIDLRDSTQLLNKHNKSTVAKLLKAYYYAIIKVAKSLDGELRSFNGDSLLVFFQGTTQASLSTAVEAAMKMTYILSYEETIQSKLSKYSKLNYGIGIDYGSILCTKVGLGGDSDNKDLVWIGNAVNKSTVLSDIGRNPNYIYISHIVYNNLLDRVKYHIQKDSFGNEQKINMWTSKIFQYNNSNETSYFTSYYWKIH